MVRHLNVPLEDEEYERLRTWKERAERDIGTDVSWGELLVAASADPAVVEVTRRELKKARA